MTKRTIVSLLTLLLLSVQGVWRGDICSAKQEEGAVTDALRWLARHQHPDGHWGVSRYTEMCGKAGFNGTCAPNPGDDQHDTGVTGLALLAYLGAGYIHTSQEAHDGIRFGDVVKKGLTWLAEGQDAEGCLAPRKGEYMYNHLLASLALTEAYGLSKNGAFKASAQKAVDFVVAAQNDGKGWRYTAKSGDSDSSVTGWAVMTLKSAQMADLKVPASAFEGAKAWYDAVTMDNGAVGYVGKMQGKVSIRGVNDQFEHHEAMTAMALFSRIMIDKSRSDGKVKSGADLLSKDLPQWKGNAIDCYYWHLGSLALLQYDGSNGDLWKKWGSLVKEALVKNQNRESAGDKWGSWEPVDRWSPKGGRVYVTAINCLTLETCAR